MRWALGDHAGPALSTRYEYPEELALHRDSESEHGVQCVATRLIVSGHKTNFSVPIPKSIPFIPVVSVKAGASASFHPAKQAFRSSQHHFVSTF